MTSDGIVRLVALLEPLSAAGKLGPMLWQLPPNFGRDDERLADADWERFAVENALTLRAVLAAGTRRR